jgi:hypothetical protein
MKPVVYATMKLFLPVVYFVDSFFCKLSLINCPLEGKANEFKTSKALAGSIQAPKCETQTRKLVGIVVMPLLFF